MAVVTFDEDIWLVARWAFKRLLDDVQEKFDVNPDIQYDFEQAIALDGLHFEFREKNRLEILYMVKVTIIELIDDKTESYRKTLDKKGYHMYREALPELLSYIEKYEKKVRQVETRGDKGRQGDR